MLHELPKDQTLIFIMGGGQLIKQKYNPRARKYWYCHLCCESLTKRTKVWCLLVLPLQFLTSSTAFHQVSLLFTSFLQPPSPITTTGPPFPQQAFLSSCILSFQIALIPYIFSICDSHFQAYGPCIGPNCLFALSFVI